MEKEELFNDGVSFLETILGIYLKNNSIEKKDSNKYYVSIPKGDITPTPKLMFPIFRKIDEDNVKLIEYYIINLNKFDLYNYEIIYSNEDKLCRIQDLNYEKYKEEITQLAKIFYIAKCKINPLDSIENAKNTTLLYEELGHYIQKIKFIEENTEKDKEEIETIDFINNMTPEYIDTTENKTDLYIDVEQKPTNNDSYEKTIERLNLGNSENIKYDFDFIWKPESELKYISDDSLELAYLIIEKGSLKLKQKELKDGKKKLVVVNTMCPICDSGLTTKELIEKINNHEQINDKEIFQDKVYEYTARINPFTMNPNCLNCEFERCPKPLAAYILYLKNNGLLKEKLEERRIFKENNKCNSFFEFNWKIENGLKNVSQKAYEYAEELVKRKLIYVSNTLDEKGRIVLHSKVSCNDIKIHNYDISKLDDVNEKSKWNTMTRGKNTSDFLFCSAYTCRLDSCPLHVAGYIYYLKKLGLEHQIEKDRKYYEENKEQVEKDIAEKKQKQLDRIENKKDESINSFEKYTGKISNLKLLLDSISYENQNNLFCIISGNDVTEKNAFIHKIIKILDEKQKIKDYREMTMQNFSALNTHFESVILLKDKKKADKYNIYDPSFSIMHDDESEYSFPKYGLLLKNTIKKDSKNLRYKGRNLIIRTETEENILYILNGISEFISDYLSIKNERNSSETTELRKKQMEHAVELITKMSENNYIIINAKPSEIDSFMALDPRLKFVYQDNIFTIPDLTIDEMYEQYLVSVKPNILEQIREEGENYKKKFEEYIALNKSFMPFDDRELVNYLVSYTSSKGMACFPENIYKKETIEESLKNIIGMQTIKEKLKNFEKYMLFQIKAKANNMNLKATNLHMIFTGNPGTGKTTIARIMAKMLFDLGLISENKLIEVERKDLIGQHIGQTAPKTAEVIDKAMGGVLFIDEAYSLANGGNNDFGSEAIATLIKAMEDNKDKLVVIFAGYRNEMKKFTDMNPGIASRIGYTFDFPDYSVKELMDIFYLKMKKSGFECQEDIDVPLKRLCEYYSRRKDFGNGRFIDKVMQETIMKHAINDNEHLKMITLSDIPTIEDLNQNTIKNNSDIDEMLSQIVGMDQLKEKLKEFRQYVEFIKEAEERQISIPSSSMHMIFTGNPGTGKTTIARIIAKMLFDMEIIHENKLVEVERKDLIAGYVGQTAIKTADVIDKAMGGVLFVDEAYSLANDVGSQYGFGEEAIATLIKAMEDHKGEFVVIFAGYKKEMKRFTDVNPGIASRIGYIFDFEDYGPEELVEIFVRKVKKTGLELEENATNAVLKVMRYFCNVQNFGNGRFVDKVFSQTLLKHSNKTGDDIIKISVDDIPDINEMTKIMLGGSRMIDVTKITKVAIRKTAVHEVGHAIARMLLMDNPGIKKITINAEGTGTLGYVKHNGWSGSYTPSKKELLNRIQVNLAGIANEKIYYGEYESGGSSDLWNATNTAKQMITELGMSSIGLAQIYNPTGDIQKLVLEEENKILEECFNDVTKLLSDNKEKIDKVVEYLVEHTEISEEELIAVYNS